MINLRREINSLDMPIGRGRPSWVLPQPFSNCPSWRHILNFDQILLFPAGLLLSLPRCIKLKKVTTIEDTNVLEGTHTKAK